MEKITFFDKKTGEHLYNVFYNKKENSTYIVPAVFGEDTSYRIARSHGYDLFRMFRNICSSNEMGNMGVYINIEQ